jgi:hypothetical protein
MRPSRQRVLALLPFTLVAAAGAAHAAPPLEVPAPAARPASWVPSATAKRAGLPQLTLHAASPTAALAATGRGPRALVGDAFAFVPDRGVLGPLRLPPRTTWLGLLDGDRVLAATADGRLHEAAAPAAAAAGAFTARGAVPDAQLWDAAGSTVVAATAKAAFVSRDGGRTFRAHPFPVEPSRVFARRDGVAVVVLMRGWPFVSRDGGATFTQPPLPADPDFERRRKTRTCPKSVFGADKSETWGTCWSTLLGAEWERRGDWIGATAYLGGGGCDGKDRCHSYYNCVQGALAADGATWLAPMGAAARPAADWLAPFALGATLRASTLPPWPAAPPPRGRSAVEVSRECDVDPAAWFHRGGRGGGLGSLWGGRSCKGLACLRQPSAEERPAHALFADAGCAAADCDGPVARPPSALAVDPTGRFAVSRLPCAPTRLLTAAGAALVVCRDGPPHAAWLADAAGRWHAQAPLPMPPDALQVAADGTLLATTRCGAKAPCRAFVRAPAPLATAVPFAEVTAPGALGYRASPGGRALVIAPPRQAYAAEPEVDVRGVDSKPVVRGIHFDPFADWHVRLHPLVPLVASCLRQAAGPPAAGVLKVTVSVDASGALGDVTVTDAPDAGTRSCVVAGVRRLPLRKPDVALVASRWVGFTTIQAAFSLAVAEPGRAAHPLGADVRLPGGLLDVRLDGRRVLIDCEDGNRERTYRIARDGTLTSTGDARLRSWPVR